MTVRITITSRDNETILKVDGWLTAEDTAELVRASRDCPRDAILDLSELRHATVEGLETLVHLRRGGTRLTNAPPLLAMLLERSGGAEGCSSPPAEEAD